MKSLILLALALTTFATAAETHAHLFILSGHSNMAGMDPKPGFEPEAKKLFPEADVAYIKVAAGRQPIRYWVNGTTSLPRIEGKTPAESGRPE